MSELSHRLLFAQELPSLWKPHLLVAGTGGRPPKHNLSQEALCDKQKPVDETYPVLQVISEMCVSTSPKGEMHKETTVLKV